MVRQTVEGRGGHLGVAEDRGPFAEAQIGGDGDAGALVELAEQMEQQGAVRSASGRSERGRVGIAPTELVHLHKAHTITALKMPSDLL